MLPAKREGARVPREGQRPDHDGVRRSGSEPPIRRPLPAGRVTPAATRRYCAPPSHTARVPWPTREEDPRSSTEGIPVILSTECLVAPAVVATANEANPSGPRRGTAGRPAGGGPRRGFVGSRGSRHDAWRDAAALLLAAFAVEIGRASCRERV